MKKIFLLNILLSMVCLLQAQVGVNTTNPKGLFHVDGASTPATTNPSSGAVSALQATDDVIITAAGNVGVGHINPTQRLDILSATPKKGLRIANGSEGNLKVLTSMGPGLGYWSKVAGIWYAGLLDAALSIRTTGYGYRNYENYVDEIISSNVIGAVDKTAGTITVPYNGLYRITQTAYFSNSRGISGTPYKACIALVINGGGVWSPLALGITITNGVYPTFTTVRTLSKDDVLSLTAVELDDTYANGSNRAQLYVEFISE